MGKAETVLRPAIWVFYAVIVLEFLFMISPFALYFCSAYAPVLNVLRLSPATAWLTQFYLPHFSETTSTALNEIHGLASLLVGVGLLVFVAGAVPVYLGKVLRWGPITGGLYRFIRHPQHLGLAIVGLGTALIWPRFIVLLGLVR
jgi:protein-S-isoprenylcysteine O-methyltransferase Ste14